MADYFGKAPLTIVVLKSGSQKYIYGPSSPGESGDPYPEDAADGERERHHAEGFVGAEDETYDAKSKTWGKTKSTAKSDASKS